MSRTLELRRMGALRAANICGIVCFVLYGVLAAVMAPLFLVVSALVPSQPGQPPMWVFSLMLLAYPLLGAIFGWIFGLLSAAIYNLVSRWTGGLLLEFEERAS